ncbi:hypothetical protein [Luteibacter yeojuensis]
MTNRTAYATLVDRIFGSGSAVFDTSVASSNDVIGALSRPDNYAHFKENFEARLHRLNAAIVADHSLRKEVLGAVNRIAEAGWDGAYAELAALDYFLGGSETGPGNLLLDHTVPASDTLASEMGMQNANHDLSFPALGVCADTKLLSDKIREILEGIFKDYRSAKQIGRLSIVPSYHLDGDFTQYSARRRDLVNELVNGVDPAVKPKKLVSAVIPGLSYSFAWDRGVYSGEGWYSPLEHARQHHPLLFGHAKKFSRVDPTVIVFVLFPWSGEKVFPFERQKRIFFRQFGDHFFNDYVASNAPANAFNKKFKSAISSGDVTRYLSGVIYLEDQAITSANPGLLNVDASYVWNKNAMHSLFGHAFEKSLQARGAFDLNTFDLAEPLE